MDSKAIDRYLIHLNHSSRETVDGVGLSSRRRKHYSIFVGALHGLITARALFSICDDLFGNVTCVIVDTDRYHYPTGKYYTYAQFRFGISGAAVTSGV